jgi:hypothetical protein
MSSVVLAVKQVKDATSNIIYATKQWNPKSSSKRFKKENFGHFNQDRNGPYAENGWPRRAGILQKDVHFLKHGLVSIVEGKDGDQDCATRHRVVSPQPIGKLFALY